MSTRIFNKTNVNDLVRLYTHVLTKQTYGDFSKCNELIYGYFSKSTCECVLFKQLATFKNEL